MATIRAASMRDLPGAYRVGLLTGDAGRDASAIYRNPELLGHVFVGPYVVGQPDLALVVADDAGIAGYLLAAADTRAFEAWAEEHWWPPLRDQYPLKADGSPESELIELFYRAPFADDSVVVPFPSHLHIDLLERVRGQGFARQLIERLLEELRRRDSPGVHLDVDIANANAIAFYRHLGFDELERSHDALVMGLRLGA
jgi:ribosomal protein S18 acetylase RimI-like enzyme